MIILNSKETHVHIEVLLTVLKIWEIAYLQLNSDSA